MKLKWIYENVLLIGKQYLVGTACCFCWNSSPPTTTLKVLESTEPGGGDLSIRSNWPPIKLFSKFNAFYSCTTPFIHSFIHSSHPDRHFHINQTVTFTSFSSLFFLEFQSSLTPVPGSNPRREKAEPRPEMIDSGGMTECFVQVGCPSTPNATFKISGTTRTFRHVHPRPVVALPSVYFPFHLFFVLFFGQRPPGKKSRFSLLFFFSFTSSQVLRNTGETKIRGSSGISFFGNVTKERGCRLPN